MSNRLCNLLLNSKLRNILSSRRISTIVQITKQTRKNHIFNQNIISRSFAVEPIKESDPIPPIDETSWAAEQLKEQGEKLAPAPTEPVFINDPEDFVVNQPSERVKKIAQTMLTMNFIEVNQLVFYLQKRLGMTDEQLFYRSGLKKPGVDYSHLERSDSGSSSGDAAAAPKAAAAAPVAEKIAFDLKLKAVDAKAKIKIIKEVRTITGLGLKEAKELVEKAPVVIKQGLKKDEVEAFKKLLVEAGAEIEVI